MFHVHVSSDLVSVDEQPPEAMAKTPTLPVDAYPGEEVQVMFHGTDSRSAQLIACSQRFRRSAGGLLGANPGNLRAQRIHHS